MTTGKREDLRRRAEVGTLGPRDSAAVLELLDIIDRHERERKTWGKPALFDAGR